MANTPGAHRAPATSAWPDVRRTLTYLMIAAVVTVIGVGGYWALDLWSDWRSVARVEFDPVEARERLEADTGPLVSPDYFQNDNPIEFTNEIPLPLAAAGDLSDRPIDDLRAQPGTTTLPEDGSTTTTFLPPPPTSAVSGYSGYLLIGSDGSPSAGNADAIFLAIDSGGGPILVSVPRSLYINNPCTETPMRLALLLRGCPGVAGGADLVALALEDFTGVQIIHYAVIGYDGFGRIVDGLGGIEICSDTARGLSGQIIIPAGCTIVDGAAATFWVTNRSQDEFVDGNWRAVAGDDELSRLERERIAMFAVYKRIGSLGSPGTLTSLGQSVADTFVLDGGFSLSGAVDLAWSMRGGLRHLSIPVRSELTPDGRYVLYPTEPFSTTLGG